MDVLMIGTTFNYVYMLLAASGMNMLSTVKMLFFSSVNMLEGVSFNDALFLTIGLLHYWIHECLLNYC